MRSSKAILIAAALLLVVFTAWAGSDAAANKPKSDRDQAGDKTAVAPAQPADKTGESDRAPQPGPESNPPPQARPESNQSPMSRPEPNQAPRPEPSAVQTSNSPALSGPPVISDPPIRNPPSGPRAPGRPPRGGYGGHRGGPGWPGWHDAWRHRNFHGSWSFLFHFGPVIYPAPVYFPHVLRLPRNKVGVYVRQTGDDYVGAQFAESIREHLREQGLAVAYSPDNAQLELYLVSMDEDPEETGYGSAVSVSYVWYPGHRFITAQIVDVGVNEVDDLAASVAGYTDDLVDQYR